MRGIVAFLLMWFIVGSHFSSAAAGYVDSVISGPNWNVSENTMISEQSVIDVDHINITNSIYLENQGNVNGDIFVCDGCELYIRNSGNVSGTFYAGPGSDIVQIIKTSKDITFLDFGGSDFSVLVQGQEEICLSDIMKIARGANKITLDNTSILLDPKAPQPRFFSFDNPAIELVGNITIKLKDLKDLLGRPILSNVSGDGLIYISSPDLDLLYIASTYIKDNNLYFQINRETDYMKILGDVRGRFLNKVRDIFPENSTIAALDGAKTMAQLQEIVSRSIMFNPINLMRPIKLFNGFEISAFTKLPNSELSGPNIGIESIYISTDELSLKGGKISTGMKTENMDLAISFYAGSFDSNEKINEFSGIMYGINVQTLYDDKSLFINTKAGFTFAKFETGFLFDGQGVTYNPNGISVYGVFDFGNRYEFNENISISPYLGVVAEYNAVLNQKDMFVLGRIGTTIGYSFEENGIHYDYEVLTSLRTDGTISVGIGVSFWSGADGAGGGFSYSVYSDDLGVAHKFMIDIRFAI